MVTKSQAANGRLDVWRQVYLREGRRWDNLPSLTAHMALGDIFSKKTSISLLDVGCGYCRDLLFFSHFMSSLDLCGVDLVPEAIRMGAALVPEANLATGDFQSLDLHGYRERFDIVYSNYFLHLFDESEAVSILRRMRSCLRPGGLMVSSVVSVEDPHFATGGRSLLDERIFEVLPSIRWRFYDPQEVRRVANSADLKIVRCAPYREVELVRGEIDLVSGLYVVLSR